MPFMVNITAYNVSHKRHIAPYLVKNKPKILFEKIFGEEEE